MRYASRHGTGSKIGAILLIVCAVGCGPNRKLSEVGLLSEDLCGKPQWFIFIDNHKASGERIKIGRLALVLPVGYAVAEDRVSLEISDPHVSLSSGAVKGVFLAIFRARNGIVSDPPEWLLDTLEPHIASPREFLRSFQTDREFYREAYSAQPDDLREAVGSRRAEVAALLATKRSLIWPAAEVRTSHLTAFYTHVESGDDRDVVAELLCASFRRICDGTDCKRGVR
jgi:hypothetical protein